MEVNKRHKILLKYKIYRNFCSQSSFKITANNAMLKEIKEELKKLDNKEISLAGVDFIVEREKKIKCMLCLTYGSHSISGVIKHISSSIHKRSYIKTCFPSTFKYLKNMELKLGGDEFMQIISKSLLMALMSLICTEIARNNPDHFIPWIADKLSEREFNSLAFVNHINDNLLHINEKDFPATKEIVNDTIAKFMDTANEFLKKIGFGSEKCKEKQASLSQTEFDRMTVAIKIAHDVFSKGLQMSPSQLEMSVRSYYIFEFQKSMTNEDLETLDDLSVSDIKYLLDNFEELLKSEQEKLVKFLGLLRKTNHAFFNELSAHRKYANFFKGKLSCRVNK